MAYHGRRARSTARTSLRRWKTMQVSWHECCRVFADCHSTSCVGYLAETCKCTVASNLSMQLFLYLRQALRCLCCGATGWAWTVSLSSSTRRPSRSPSIHACMHVRAHMHIRAHTHEHACMPWHTHGVLVLFQPCFAMGEFVGLASGSSPVSASFFVAAGDNAL